MAYLRQVLSCSSVLTDIKVYSVLEWLLLCKFNFKLFLLFPVIFLNCPSCSSSAAARALVDEPHLDAGQVALKAMNIAADMCVFTNHNFIIETIDVAAKTGEAVAADEPLK